MVRQKLDALTSLRFFAALAIVAFHARGHFGLPGNLLSPFELSQGVSFFFVLSGFILAFVYPDLSGKGARGRFWKARLARLWPVHLFALVLYLALLNDYHCAGLGPLLANLGLVQSIIPLEKWCFSYNAVSWSISTEVFFYLAFPFLIADFEKNWAVKLGGSFLLVLALIGLTNAFHLPATADTSVSALCLLYANPLCRLFEFVLGMTISHFYRKYLVNLKAGYLAAFGCELTALILLFLLTFNTFKISGCLCRLPFVQEGARLWLERGGIPLLAFAALIAVVAWGRGPLARLLSFKGFVLLGEISFSAYLLHRIFLLFYCEHFAGERGFLPMAICALVILAASYACWSLLEVPCRQWIVGGRRSIPRPTLAGGLASAFSLLLLPVVWFGIWSGPELQRLEIGEVNAVLPSCTTSGAGAAGDYVKGRRCDIAFGDDLLLLGAQTVPENNGLKVILYWQALRDLQIDHNISLHFLDGKNTRAGSRAYKQSYREEWLEKGECFRNELSVPASELAGVRRLAICPYSPVRPLMPARALRDLNVAGGVSVSGNRATVDLGPGLVAASPKMAL